MSNFRVEQGKFGKCLISTKNLSIGEIILKEIPFHFTLSDSLVQTHCTCCMQTMTKKFRCTNCKYVHYCSLECQKKDWNNHKEECKSIKKIYPNVATESIRLMARILERRQADPEKYARYSNLITHQEKRQDLMNFIQMSILVNEFVSKDSKLSPEEITSHFCRFTCNNFNIFDEDHNSVGTGIYLEASLLNHSCEPNCVVVFDKNQLILRAITEITKDSELTISYTELAASSITRNRILSSRYYFTCDCNRCHNKIGDDLLLGILCPTCKVLIKSELCSKCEKWTRDQIQEELDNATIMLSQGELHEAFEIQHMFLHPCNEQLLVTTSALMKSFIDSQDFTNGIRFCLLTIPPFELCYPKHYTLLGLQYLILAKLFWFYENPQDAYPLFLKAVGILKVVYGDCPLVRNIIDTIKIAEAELSMMSKRKPRIKTLKFDHADIKFQFLEYYMNCGKLLLITCRNCTIELEDIKSSSNSSQVWLPTLPKFILFILSLLQFQLINLKVIHASKNYSLTLDQLTYSSPFETSLGFQNEVNLNKMKLMSQYGNFEMEKFFLGLFLSHEVKPNSIQVKIDKITTIITEIPKIGVSSSDTSSSKVSIMDRIAPILDFVNKIYLEVKINKILVENDGMALQVDNSIIFQKTAQCKSLQIRHLERNVNLVLVDSPYVDFHHLNIKSIQVNIIHKVIHDIISKIPKRQPSSESQPIILSELIAQVPTWFQVKIPSFNLSWKDDSDLMDIYVSNVAYDDKIASCGIIQTRLGDYGSLTTDPWTVDLNTMKISSNRMLLVTNSTIWEWLRLMKTIIPSKTDPTPSTSSRSFILPQFAFSVENTEWEIRGTETSFILQANFLYQYFEANHWLVQMLQVDSFVRSDVEIPYLVTPLFYYELNQEIVYFKGRDLLFNWTVVTKLQISKIQAELKSYQLVDSSAPTTPAPPSRRKTTQVQLDGFQYRLKYTNESTIEFKMNRLETNCYEIGYQIDDLFFIVNGEEVGTCKHVEYARNEEYVNTFQEYQEEMSEQKHETKEMRQLLFENLKFSFLNQTTFGEATGQLFLARRYMNEILGIKPELPTKSVSLLLMVKDFRFELCDNPLETTLMLHQQLWPAEFTDREVRERLLYKRAKERGIEPTSEMLQELENLNSKIYLEKMMHFKKTSEHRQLLSLESKEFEITFKREAYTMDSILNWSSTFGLPLRKIGDKFAPVIVSFYQHVSWNIGETNIWIRGYPLPLCKFSSTTGYGTFCYWKYPPGKRETIMRELELDNNQFVQVAWHLVPSMLFFDAKTEPKDLELCMGKSWSPAFTDMQMFFDKLVPKTLDPTVQKGWWDKLRHRLHCTWELNCQPKIKILSGGNNLYEIGEYLELLIDSLYCKYSIGQVLFKVHHLNVTANPSLSLFPSMAEVPFVEGFVKWRFECLGDPNNPFFEFAIPPEYQVWSKRNSIRKIPEGEEAYDSYKEWKTTTCHLNISLFTSPHETHTSTCARMVAMSDPLSLSFLIRFLQFYLFSQWRISRARMFRFGQKKASPGLFQFLNYTIEFNGFDPMFVWSNGVLTNHELALSLGHIFVSLHGNAKNVLETINVELIDGNAKLFGYSQEGWNLSQDLVHIEKIGFTKIDTETDFPFKLIIESPDAYYSASTRDAVLIWYDLLDQFLFQREYKKKVIPEKKVLLTDMEPLPAGDDLLRALLGEEKEKEVIKDIVEKKFSLVVNNAKIIIIGDKEQGLTCSFSNATFEFLTVSNKMKKLECLGLVNDVTIQIYQVPEEEDKCQLPRRKPTKTEETKNSTTKNLIEKSPWIIRFVQSATKSLEFEIPEIELNLSAQDIKLLHHIFTHVLMPKKMVRKVISEELVEELIYKSALDPKLLQDVNLAQKKCEALLREIKQMESQVPLLSRNTNKEEALLEVTKLKEEIVIKKTMYQAMKETLQKKVDESRTRNHDIDMVIGVVIHNTTWNMLNEKDDVFMKSFFTLIKVELTKHKDYSQVYSISCHYFNIKNFMPNPIFDDLLVPMNQNYGDEEYILRVYLAKNNGVGGIRVVDHLEIEIAPIHMQMTYTAYKLLWRYFFPKPPKTDKTLTPTKSLPILGWKRISKFTAKEDVDVMKYRAKNLVCFNYVKIHAVKLMFSLKGVPEEKMLKIVRNFDNTKLELNDLIYTQKTMTYNELFVMIKKDEIKQAVSYIPSTIKSVIANKFSRKSSQVNNVPSTDKKLEHSKKLMEEIAGLKKKAKNMITMDELSKMLLFGKKKEDKKEDKKSEKKIESEKKVEKKVEEVKKDKEDEKKKQPEKK